MKRWLIVLGIMILVLLAITLIGTIFFGYQPKIPGEAPCQMYEPCP